MTPTQEPSPKPKMTDAEMFAKVELVRKHMLLTTSQMAELLGTSRATYYQWQHGQPIRASNKAIVIRSLQRMLKLAKSDRTWPTDADASLTSAKRYSLLVELLGD